VYIKKILQFYSI